MSDSEIYASEEYHARIERVERSLNAVVVQNGNYEYAAIKTAAESIAYWQMRTVYAERLLLERGDNNFLPTKISTRFE